MENDTEIQLTKNKKELQQSKNDKSSTLPRMIDNKQEHKSMNKRSNSYY